MNTQDQAIGAIVRLRTAIEALEEAFRELADDRPERDLIAQAISLASHARERCYHLLNEAKPTFSNPR